MNLTGGASIIRFYRVECALTVLPEPVVTDVATLLPSST